MKLVENNLEEHMQLRGGVQFLDEIPHTHTGKIARNQLKEMAKCFVFDYVHVQYNIYNNAIVNEKYCYIKLYYVIVMACNASDTKDAIKMRKTHKQGYYKLL